MKASRRTRFASPPRRLVIGCDGSQGARDMLTAGLPLPPSIETRTIRSDSAAEVLADLAGDERRDLIVVGSPHRGVLGSVAKALIHRSPAPVAVAPHGFVASPGLRRLVVGFDGSPEAEAALEWAESLAAAQSAELEVFTVATPPVSMALIGSVTDVLVTAPSCPVVAVPISSHPPAERRLVPDGVATPSAEDGAA